MASGWRGILGFEYGIVQAPLGPDISGPELAAAVANAGGIGLVRLPDWPAPDNVKELIRKTRSLTSRPFGVAIVLAFPHEENLRVVLEEKVAMLQVYWGEFPRERVEEAHRAGVKVLHQVGSVEEAAKAKEAGVDGIIVQGREAGGHVIGQITRSKNTWSLCSQHLSRMLTTSKTKRCQDFVTAVVSGCDPVVSLIIEKRLGSPPREQQSRTSHLRVDAGPCIVE